MLAERRGAVVVPMLSYEDVAIAAGWLADAFAFRETGRWSDPDGRVTQIAMEHEGAEIMLGWPGPDYQSPRHHAAACEIARAWSTTGFVVDGVLVYVDDLDGHLERSTRAGAKVLSAIEEVPTIGIRLYRAEDVEGHRWMFAQPI